MSDLYCLGKQPANLAKIAKCVQAHDVLDLSRLPSVPAAFDWSQRDGDDFTYPMLANDRYGDCVFASACHQISTWSGQTGVQQALTDEDATDAYHRFTGWSPAVLQSDRGAVMADVAERWSKGEPIAWHTLRAYVSVNAKNLALMSAAANLFGGLWTGWALPVAWQGADIWTQRTNQADVWAPGSWGGHAVHIVAASPKLWQVVTWGGLKPVETDAFPEYCDEAYALVSPGMWTALQGGLCPAGVDVQRLLDMFPVLG